MPVTTCSSVQVKARPVFHAKKCQRRLRGGALPELLDVHGRPTLGDGLHGLDLVGGAALEHGADADALVHPKRRELGREIADADDVASLQPVKHPRDFASRVRLFEHPAVKVRRVSVRSVRRLCIVVRGEDARGAVRRGGASVRDVLHLNRLVLVKRERKRGDVADGVHGFGLDVNPGRGERVVHEDTTRFLASGVVSRASNRAVTAPAPTPTTTRSAGKETPPSTRLISLGRLRPGAMALTLAFL